MTWFFAASRVLIVAGKGGVGKTTLGATLGLAAARSGQDVLLVQTSGLAQPAGPTDVGDPIARLFGVAPLGYRPTDLLGRSHLDEPAGRLRGCSLAADRALTEYLEVHGLDRLIRLDRPSGGRSALELLTAAIPGIRDLLLLGKIRQLEVSGAAELIIVDAPSSGHAVTFLRAAAALADTNGSGPIREQAELAAEFLVDGTRCQVALATLAEETPVGETIETAFAIEERLGVKLAPVLVNARWPDQPGLAADLRRGDRRRTTVRRLHAAARFRLDKVAAQEVEAARLADELPLPQLHFPHLGFIADGGDPDRGGLETLARYVTPDRLGSDPVFHPRPGDVDPPADASAPSVRIVNSAGRTVASAGAVGDVEVLVCLGPGGVGKTTTAAALAMAAAGDGRRVALITVDPARRLAAALGLDTLSHVPEPVAGPWESTAGGGALWACMLDTEKTFARLIGEYATSAAQAERITGHRLFRQLTTSLSGTHEYLAIDQLWHLHQAGDFDLVVVDTPPAENALDLLDSAHRLVRFIDHPLYRSILAPRGRLGRVTAVAARSIASVVGRLIGLGLVDEVTDFFAALGEMDDGFRSRSSDMADLLSSPAVGYVLVTTPRSEALERTAALASRLPSADDGSPVRAWLLVNRLMPRFGTADAGAQPADPTGTRLEAATANAVRLERIAEREEELIDAWSLLLDLPTLGRLDEQSETIASVDAAWRLANRL